MLPSTPHLSRPRRPHFTIVELLVVMAIIAILASMLFGAVARVKEKARRTVCVSNLTQIGIACQLYANDSESWFPVYEGLGSLVNPRGDYLPEEGAIWACPSELYPGSTPWDTSYYYYIGYKQTTPNPDAVALANEDGENHRQTWYHELYIDGHVEGRPY
jgi:prepilin-type N-terminal cleavage/methylation domain-containing protein